MAKQNSTQNPADIVRAIAAGGSLATDGIQTDPEVREAIGQAIMTSIICTHQDDEWPGSVCPTCWESTQRIGTALVLALPQLRLAYDASFPRSRHAIEGLLRVHESCESRILSGIGIVYTCGIGLDLPDSDDTRGLADLNRQHIAEALYFTDGNGR